MAPAAPTTGLLLQMIEQNDEKYEDAHRRLRATCREIDQRMGILEAAQTNLSIQLAKPVDVNKIRMSPSVVAAIVVASLSIAGSVWASKLGLESQQRESEQRILTQIKAVDTTQTERANQLHESMSDLKRRQEMQAYEIQNLKELVLKQRRF